MINQTSVSSHPSTYDVLDVLIWYLMRFSNNVKVHVRNVNDMTVGLK